MFRNFFTIKCQFNLLLIGGAVIALSDFILVIDNMLYVWHWGNRHAHYNIEFYSRSFAIVTVPIVLWVLLTKLAKKNDFAILRLYERRLPNLRKSVLSSFLLLNILLLPIAIKQFPYSSVRDIFVHILDEFRQYETAEKVFSFERYGGSFIAASRHSSSDRNGIKASDPLFDNILINTYGSDSPQMVRRQIQLSVYHWKKNNDLIKAKDALLKALQICERKKDLDGQIEVLSDFAQLNLKSKNTKDARSTLLDARNRIIACGAAKDFWAYNLVDLAKKCDDLKLAKEFESFGPRYAVDPRYGESAKSNAFSWWVKAIAGFIVLVLMIIKIEKALEKKCILEAIHVFQTSKNPLEIEAALSDLIILEKSRKNYQAADHYSQRLLKLAEESA